ncbi:MAG: hypothetical protein ACYC6P_14640 [Ignavibacteriaceae bacterium]
MKKFFQLLFVIVLFIVKYGYSQTANKDTADADTVSANIRKNNIKSNNYENSLNHNIHPVIKKESLFLELSRQNYNVSKFSFENNNPYMGVKSIDERTAFFKKNFATLLSLKLKDSKKYDLGVITEYLGISQTWAAIILAILSVAK